MDTKEHFTDDLLNFIEMVINQTLYSKKIYPEVIFESRSMYGLRVKVVKKCCLYDYIHQLMDDLKILLDCIESIRINLISDTEIKEYVDIELDRTLSFIDFEHIPPKFERDFLFKKLLYQLIEKFSIQSSFDFSKTTQVNSFEIQLLSNGSEAQKQKQKNNILEKWLLDKIYDSPKEYEQEKRSQDKIGVQQHNMVESVSLAELTIGIFNTFVQK